MLQNALHRTASDLLVVDEDYTAQLPTRESKNLCKENIVQQSKARFLPHLRRLFSHILLASSIRQSVDLGFRLKPHGNIGPHSHYLRQALGTQVPTLPPVMSMFGCANLPPSRSQRGRLLSSLPISNASQHRKNRLHQEAQGTTSMT